MLPIFFGVLFYRLFQNFILIFIEKQNYALSERSSVKFNRVHRPFYQYITLRREVLLRKRLDQYY